MESPISKDATITGMKSNSRLHLLKWGIVFGLTILYSIGSLFLLPIFGITVISFSAIPVAAAGWTFGLTGGIVASLAAMVLNNFLVVSFGGIPWYTVDRSGFFMGAAILMLVGVSFAQIKKYSDARLDIETQLRSRERYLTVLKITTSNILNPQKPGNRYYDLVTHFVNLFVADHGYYFSWNVKQKQATLITSTLPIEQQSSGVLLESHESAIIETVIQTAHAMVMDDVLNSQEVFNTTLFKNPARPVHSALGIPLIARQDIIGIIILAYNVPRIFTAEEIDRAEQGGQQVALALRSIQQEYKIEKQLHQTTTLSNVEHVLSRSERVGVDAVLQLIVDSAMELIPKTNHVVLHLLDEEKQILIPRSVAGLAKGYRSQLNMRLGKGVAGQVLETAEIIYIPDIRIDSRFIGQTLPISYKSLLVAPIRSDERCIGTISIHSDDAGAFDADDASLLGALGLKATIALENARLLENTQQALKEANALYRINQELVTSLNSAELSQDVVNLLQKNFGYYHVQFYILERKSGDLVLHAASGEIGRQLKEEGYRLQAGEGIIGFTAETGAPFFTNDVDNVHFFLWNQLLADTKSELAVPVKISGYLLGVLDVQQIPPINLTEHDLQLVTAVADQLAIALQKAALYTDLQAALQTEKAIRNQMVQSEQLVTMGRLLASVSHELNNPLQAIQNALYLLRDEQGISLQGKLDLDIVLSEAERMSDLIERLRDTYRPTQAEDFLPTQINNIVEDIYALISTHLRQNQIRYEFTPDLELPLIPLLPNRIRQVILNLLMNAIEIMVSGGKITVTTKYCRDSNEVLLTVSDSGPGITPDLLPKVFEAFVTNKAAGTGLGLTISHDIVIQHHGRIEAENNPDQPGAIFKVWLPIQNMAK